MREDRAQKISDFPQNQWQKSINGKTDITLPKWELQFPAKLQRCYHVANHKEMTGPSLPKQDSIRAASLP